MKKIFCDKCGGPVELLVFTDHEDRYKYFVKSRGPRRPDETVDLCGDCLDFLVCFMEPHDKPHARREDVITPGTDDPLGIP